MCNIFCRQLSKGGCEIAQVSKLGVLGVTLWVSMYSGGVQLGLSQPGSPFVGPGQEYPGKSGVGGGSRLDRPSGFSQP